MTVGSIEGDGLVLLGSRKLTAGGNSLSTIFAGTIKMEAKAEEAPWSRLEVLRLP